MSGWKGEGAHRKWKRGEKLTRGEAILAQCYDCNDGHREGPLSNSKDCLGQSCALYQYMPYRANKTHNSTQE